MTLVAEILVAWIVGIPALVVGYATIAPRWLERRGAHAASVVAAVEISAPAPRRARSA
jgi:hypothetical protein